MCTPSTTTVGMGDLAVPTPRYSSTAVLLFSAPEVDEPADAEQDRPGDRHHPQLRHRGRERRGLHERVPGQLDVDQQRVGLDDLGGPLREVLLEEIGRANV